MSGNLSNPDPYCPQFDNAYKKCKTCVYMLDSERFNVFNSRYCDIYDKADGLSKPSWVMDGGDCEYYLKKQKG